MLTTTDGLNLSELAEMPFDEHASLIMKVCEEVEPILAQFDAKVKLHRHDDAELLRRADYAQFSPRMLRKALTASLGDKAPM